MAATLYHTIGYHELAKIDFYSPAPIDPNHTTELPRSRREDASGVVRGHRAAGRPQADDRELI